MEKSADHIQNSVETKDPGQNLLEFEKQILQDLNEFPNCLLVLAKGLSIAKIVASFLGQFKTSKQSTSSPFLIFLLNFNDQEFAAIETYLKEQGPPESLLHLMNIQKDEKVSNKRIDQYLKGGIFSVTYKAIVLDLLTKRLSPSIITGFIINEAQKIKEKSPESFLMQILRRDNADAFIKCISDKPNSVGKGTIFGVESLMKCLQVTNLLLYPRIKASISKSLDEPGQINVFQNDIKFSKRMEQMHEILIELMLACLDELKSQIKKFDTLQSDVDNVLTIEKGLLKSFKGHFMALIGRNLTSLGSKAKCLLNNVYDIQRLIWYLLNYDCVHFYNYLIDLRSSTDFQDQFSIFRYCDTETMAKIDRLHQIAKDRIFKLELAIKDRKEPESGNSSKKENKTQLEKQYGKLFEHRLKFWQNFQENAIQNVSDLQQYEKDFEMHVQFDQTPKALELFRILHDLETKFRKSLEYKKYSAIKIRRNSTSNSKSKKSSKKTKQKLIFTSVVEEEEKDEAQNFREKEGLRETANRNVLITVKTSKMKSDLQKYLIQHFVKQDDGKGYFEEKLSYFLRTHREISKRNQVFSSQKVKRQCNPQIIETFYLQKLCLLLDQKYDYQLKKLNAKINFSKKRPREEMAGGDPKQGTLYSEQMAAAEDTLLQEQAEGEYRPCNIIDGFNVYCLQFVNSSDFETQLRQVKPSVVILYEPHLDILRALEVYNAERVSIRKEQSSLDVELMFYKDSSEFYQYMNTVDLEKIGFQKLVSLKQNLVIQLKDFKNQEEINRLTMEETKDSRKAGSGSTVIKQDQDVHKDIVVVDSREFSCSTPIYLHEKGFWLIPIVLTVGDYVLSDEICIERKSVNTGDLYESFKSGRLLTQITNMDRYYKKPVLLIEFDDSIPFKLIDQSVDSTAGGEVNPASIIAKISLLTLHYPRLQIIWSKGPSHTADIFKELKRTQEGTARDPDLQKIAKIGRVGDIDLDDCENEDDEFNRYMPQEFLKKLPGIDSNNIGNLSKQARNIVEICNMQEDDLKRIIGPKNAKELKYFLEKKVEIVKEAGEDF